MGSVAKQPEFVIGEVLTFSGIVDAAIRSIDYYSRWEVLVSLQHHVPFLAHPITPIVLLVAGLILIQRSMRRAFAESLNAAQRVQLHDEHGKAIAPSINIPTMVPTYGVIGAGLFVGAIIALVWVMNYAVPVPALALTIAVPSICKTADCFPRPQKNAPQQTPVVINAPGGIPIVGNSGTINNPVVNNFSPPKRQLTDSQITSLSEIATEIPDGQTIDMITDNTQESANYGRAIHDALKPAGAKLKSGPLFSMIPMSSLPNGPVGTVVCVSNYSDPTMPLATKIADVLVQNTPVKLLQCAGFDKTNVRITIAEP